MTLDDLLGRRVAVIGLGREGVATARLLLERGTEPLLVDDRPQAARAAAAELPGTHEVVEPGAVDWSGVDVVVRSPGVSRYRPELGEAARAGALVTTAMAVWLEDVAGAPVLAVTGTKGKSTTAALSASLLEHEGYTVALVGNIGVPVVECYDATPVDAYVVEVSSYQAADVTASPAVCVLTGLSPDHLDWHGDLETYYRDKLRLLEAGPAGAVAVCAASEEAVARTAGRPDRTLYGPRGRVRLDGGWVVADGELLVDAGDLRLPGVHNRWNLCGAIAGASLLLGRPLSADAAAAAVSSFRGLPSRCATLGVRDGVTFVDDALGSNPAATAASVAAFGGRELTVILGGADRGVDASPLADVLAARAPAPRVVVLPPDSDRVLGLLRDRQGGGRIAAVLEADDLEGAVRTACTVTPRGGVVLFSPGAPTPEGGGGYAARSRQFAAASGFGGEGAPGAT